MDQLLNQQDIEFEVTKRKELQHLLKDKENIERLLESYEEAQAKKLDVKSQKQIDMYIKEKTDSERKMDKATATTEEVYEYALRMATERRDKDIRMAEQAYDYALRKATEKRDKDRTLATTTYEKYRDYCNGHIERLGGSTEIPDPERIIRRKKELDIINTKLFYVQTILNNWKIVNKPDYVSKVVIPAKTWVPSAAALEEERKVKELRKMFVPEPEY